MAKVLYETKSNDGILMNANESYNNINEVMLQEFKDALNKVEFNRYPIDDSPALRKAYAKYIGVEADNIMVGNGSDEMLGLIISLVVKGGKKVLTLDPDFSMYDYYTSMANGELVKYPLAPDADFDVYDFIEFGRRNNIEMILFSNPNNPTGRMIGEADLLKIIEAFPRNLVVIDEAYADFADFTMIPYIHQYRNLMILRTMSKAFGMAGIRCGFMIACEHTMDLIYPYKVPYNVNVLTQTMAEISLQHLDLVDNFLQEVKHNRDDFYAAYQALNLDGITLYPSQANYIYGRCTNKQAFLAALKQHDLSIRDYRDETSFRITIDKKENNDAVLDAMKEVFEKEKAV